jgi:glycosyltransferase involved in cell wall biosynthesis
MTAPFNPKVTIAIPVYNGADYMAEAIDSALSQTYRNIEVIVVNDGSNDGGSTDDVARSYESRIRYFAKENGGVASALNFAIREATGEYISWLSHDDVYYPDKIECQVNYLREHQVDSILYSDFEYIDAKSHWIRERTYGDIKPEDFLYKLVTIGHVHGCTLLIPKKCFFETGFFNESLKSSQDYALWFLFAQRYRFEQIRKVLVKSRIHAKQGTVVMPGRLRERNELHIWFINEISCKGLVEIPGSKKSLFYLDFAIIYSKKRIYEAAKYACDQALKCARQEGMLTLLYVILKTTYVRYYIIKKRIKHRMKSHCKEGEAA